MDTSVGNAGLRRRIGFEDGWDGMERAHLPLGPETFWEGTTKKLKDNLNHGRAEDAEEIWKA